VRRTSTWRPRRSLCTRSAASSPAVNDQPSLFHLFVDLARYTLSNGAQDITCPTLLTQVEVDPIGAGAHKLLDAIASERKTLRKFHPAEGAGGRCEATARRLFHQRVYDWLDERLAEEKRTTGREPATSGLGVAPLQARTRNHRES
jgi:hypothetical protein